MQTLVLCQPSAEVAKARGKLKNGKAPGSSIILPEMLKAGGRVEEFTGMIADLVHRIWEERRVPMVMTQYHEMPRSWH